MCKTIYFPNSYIKLEQTRKWERIWVSSDKI